MRELKKEVEKIRLLSKDYPVYATLMSENLVEAFTNTNVSIKDFKDLQMDEIDKAAEIIDSVEQLHTELLKGLSD